MAFQSRRLRKKWNRSQRADDLASARVGFRRLIDRGIFPFREERWTLEKSRWNITRKLLLTLRPTHVSVFCRMCPGEATVYHVDSVAKRYNYIWQCRTPVYVTLKCVSFVLCALKDTTKQHNNILALAGYLFNATSQSVLFREVLLRSLTLCWLNFFFARLSAAISAATATFSSLILVRVSVLSRI